MPRQKSHSLLRVLFLAAEADPFIKVGGLGDVAGALPSALRRLAPLPLYHFADNSFDKPVIDIRLAIPFHSAIRKQVCNLRLLTHFNLSAGDVNLPVEVYDCEVNGVPVYLISGPPLEHEGPVYSGDPVIDGNKFIFFSLAALELARSLGFAPHILHANDWHTAPAVYSVFLKREKDPFFAETATLLSIHNLPYLGVGTGPVLAEYGLPKAENSPLPWWGKDLPLPQGLWSADHIVAVSPTYAREILTPEFGSGLYDFLQTRRADISGILNGLDVNEWDPATDKAIAKNYDVDTLALRSENKAALQQEAGLPVDPQVPLLGMINRLDNQKGVDLAIGALRQLASNGSDWQAVILGTGMAELEEAARQLQADFPERVRAVLAFNAPFSRRIYAGADALLIPSRYEPCGLAQMIAMHYGCVPIARATGGLKDTIHDYHASKHGTGFLFDDASSVALVGAIHRALEVYADKRRWRGMQRQGMKQDFSWENSAGQYLDLYEKLGVARRRAIT